MIIIQICIGHIFRLLAAGKNITTMDPCVLGFAPILVTLVSIKIQDDYLRIQYTDDYPDLEWRDFVGLWVRKLSTCTYVLTHR